VAQRICQQDRIVSLNLAKSCKESSWGYFGRTLPSCLRRFSSGLTPLFGHRHSHFHVVFQLPVFCSATMSFACGKRCDNLTDHVHPRSARTPSQSFDAQLLTQHKPLRTEFEQVLSRPHLSQQVPAQCDVELTEDNQQNPSALLSSKTVFKYSSHTERGRTTIPVSKGLHHEGHLQ
jgi:hypothetical protein